jgi:sn-glycerol 3-phosphate transport system ATP-binding protein
LGIRPEDVTLGGPLPFDIAIVEELGAHRLLHGTLAGQTFTVHVPKDTEVTTGETTISLKPEASRLFETQSGKAL